MDEFFKSYQLFRNTIRLTRNNWRNEFVVFLFPKANKAVMDDYLALKERFLTDQYQDHIKVVFWEDITSSMTDYFQKKFFPYTLKSHLSSIKSSASAPVSSSWFGTTNI